MVDDMRSRIQGALLGFACGDALGATTEFMSPAEIRREIGIHMDITGGGWLELEPGEVTDDTEMTLCVARSLAECWGFNLKDIAGRIVDWYNGDPVDIGSTCRAGIHRHIRTGSLEASYDDLGAGNGGVMRTLPLILLYSGDREFMLDAVISQSRLTHNNLESDMGCRCYADMVSQALAGATKEGLLQTASTYPLFSSDGFDGKSGGYIVETLRAVHHCFFTTGTFEDALIRCVNLGGDADTNAAILGGLAGAYYGPTAIPGRWLDSLDRDIHNELGQLAEQLAALKESL